MGSLHFMRDMKLLHNPADLTRVQQIFLVAYLKDFKERQDNKKKDKAEDEMSSMLDGLIATIQQYGRKVTPEE